MASSECPQAYLRMGGDNLDGRRIMQDIQELHEVLSLGCATKYVLFYEMFREAK